MRVVWRGVMLKCVERRGETRMKMRGERRVDDENEDRR